MLTTLDHVSNGRLIVGLGIGWRKIELDSMGINFQQRGKILDEQLDILKLFAKQSICNIIWLIRIILI